MNFINIKSYLSKFQFTHYNILREIFLIHKVYHLMNEDLIFSW
jgi:hypothetical protein